MDTLFEHDEAGVLVFGVGALGTAAAKYGLEARAEAGPALWSAIHFNAAELIASGLEKKILLRGNPNLLSPGGLARLVEESRPALERLAEGRRACVLCVESSDEHALRLTEAVSNALRGTLPVYIIALKAFSGPHDSQDNGAIDALTTPFVALLDSGMDSVTRGVSERKLRTIAAERLMSAVECTASVLDAAGELPSGSYDAIFSEQAGAGSVQTALDLALRRIDETCPRIAAVLHTAGRELPLRTLAELRRTVEPFMPEGVRVFSASDSGLGERACCIVLSARRTAQRSNVISLAEAAKACAHWR